METSPETMCQYVAEMLYTFLHSNQTARLDQSFAVSVVLFSDEHSGYLRSKKKSSLDRGLGAGTAGNTPYYCYKVPIGAPGTDEQNHQWENKCVLMALILSRLLYVYKTASPNDTAAADRLNDLNTIMRIATFAKTEEKKSPKLTVAQREASERAAKILEEEVEIFFAMCLDEILMTFPTFNRDGPYDLCQIVPFFCRLYGVQVSTFCKADKSFLVDCFPEQINDRLPQLYLYRTPEAHHVAPIKDIRQCFRGTQRLFCPYCYTTLNTSFSRSPHVNCSKRQVCDGCGQPVWRAGHAPLHTCNHIDNEETFCKRCNFAVYGDKCIAYHKSFCVKRWKCPSCGRKERQSSTHGFTQEDVKNMHECHTKKCPICYKTYAMADGEHVCKVKKAQFHAHYPYLNVLTCVSEENADPITCTLLHETATEKFEQVTFSKDDAHCVTSSHDMPYTPNAEFPISHNPHLFDNFKNVRYLSDGFGLAADVELPSARQAREDRNRKKKVRPLQTRHDVHVIPKTEQDPIEQVIAFLTSGKCFHNVIITHQTLLARIYDRLKKYEFKITLIHNGPILKSITLPERDIRFVSFQNFGVVDNDAYNLHETLARAVRKPRYIPLAFAAMRRYRGEIPELCNFVSPFDDAQTAAAKTAFVGAHRGQWNFEDELVLHSCDKNLVYALACLQFLQDMFKLQLEAEQVSNFRQANSAVAEGSKLRYLHPFMFCGLTGFAHALQKGFFWNVDNVYVLPPVCASGRPDRASKGEIEWVRFVMHTENLTDDDVIHAWNNPRGQACIRLPNGNLCKPDMISRDYETLEFPVVYQFLGCQFHAHWQHDDPPCSGVQKLPHQSLPGYLLKHKCQTYGEMRARYETQKEQLLQLFPGMSFVEKWSCEWQRQKEKGEGTQGLGDPAVMRFMSSYLKVPGRRLIPRNALRAPLVAAYSFQWDADANPTETFCIKDMRNAYGHCASSREYPVGKPTVFLRHQLVNTMFDHASKQFWVTVNGRQIYLRGLCLALVIPPKSLKLPWLLYRTSKTSVATLCRMCARNASEGFSVPMRCGHKTEQRQWYSDYTTNDVNIAYALGYRITLFEVIHYETWQPCLKNFHDFMSFKMMQCTPAPPQCLSDTAMMRSYCTNVTTQLGLELKPEDIRPDKRAKSVWKSIALSSLGRLALKGTTDSNATSRYESFTNAGQLRALLTDQNRTISAIPMLSENVLQVVTQPTHQSKAQLVDRDSCVAIYAFVLSYCRENMDQQARRLLASGASLVYQNCDCLMYTRPRNQPDIMAPDVLMSNLPGTFRDEYSDQQIVSFSSPGEGAYSIKLSKLTPTGRQFSAEIKCRGFSLSYPLHENDINAEVFRHQVKKMLDADSKSLQIQAQEFSNRRRKHQDSAAAAAAADSSSNKSKRGKMSAQSTAKTTKREKLSKKCETTQLLQHRKIATADLADFRTSTVTRSFSWRFSQKRRLVNIANRWTTLPWGYSAEMSIPRGRKRTKVFTPPVKRNRRKRN